MIDINLIAEIWRKLEAGKISTNTARALLDLPPLEGIDLIASSTSFGLLAGGKRTTP